MILRLAALLALALTFAGPGAAQTSDFESVRDPASERFDLRIGVRRHASPFSYETRVDSADMTAKSGPLRSKGFDGYMVAICDEVLKQMLIPSETIRLPGLPRITPVVIEEVMAGLDYDPVEERHYVVPDGAGVDAKVYVNDRMDLIGPKIDILCDPATLTRDRVKRFAVSPPLFLTGIGYVTRVDFVQPRQICRDDGALIGLVGGTTANQAGVKAIIDAGEWRTVKSAVIQELRNGQGCGAQLDVEEDKRQRVIQRFASHYEAANAFCNGRIDYYVGDLEIIQTHAHSIAGCDIKLGAQTFTNDRYAIFAKIDYTDTTKALWIGRFFEILNREVYGEDSVVNKAYDSTFERDSKSRKLQLFFWGLSGSTY